MKRCAWTGDNPYNNHYHDTEWGIPLHDDTKLFEFLILDTFQAGLGWLTILKKRENFRRAFDNFDFEKIAFYDDSKKSELLRDVGIIRNKMKIEACIQNAKYFIEIRNEFGSFDKYIWQFTNFKPLIHTFNYFKEIPSKSVESDAKSRNLKKRGFKFAGSTICYAFMQAAGMINDHETSCFRYSEVLKVF